MPDQRGLDGCKPYNDCLGGRVSAVYQIKAVLCCEIEAEYVIGAQFAQETGNFEVLAVPVEQMQQLSELGERQSSPFEIPLLGRKFRGLRFSTTGNYFLDFGRYRLFFDRTTGHARLTLGAEASQTCDLPGDALISLQEQYVRYQREARKRSWASPGSDTPTT